MQHHNVQTKKQYYSVGERLRQRSKLDPMSNIHEIIERTPLEKIKRKQTVLTKHCINLPTKHNKSHPHYSTSNPNTLIPNPNLT